MPGQNATGGTSEFFAMLGQGQVGAARVLPGLGPLGLTVAHEHESTRRDAISGGSCHSHDPRVVGRADSLTP